MQFAQQQGGSRGLGLGFVIGLHLLMVWALSQGLMRNAGPASVHKTDVVVIEAPPPPPEPMPMPRPQPSTALPTLPRVPLPELPPPDQDSPIQVTPTLDASVAVGPTATGASSGPELAPASPAPAETVAGADLLCPTQARPELPALGVAGVAEFRVVGTVRNGRVVGLELTALRTLSDRRAMRALQRSLETAIADGYQCTRNGRFVQDFLFRVD